MRASNWPLNESSIAGVTLVGDGLQNDDRVRGLSGVTYVPGMEDLFKPKEAFHERVVLPPMRW